MKVNPKFIEAVKTLADIKNVTEDTIIRELGVFRKIYRAVREGTIPVDDVYVNRIVEDFNVNPEFLYTDKEVPVIATYHSPQLKGRNLRERFSQV